MQIITGQEIFDIKLNRSVVTIGNFDGVHLGHIELFNRLKKHSQAHSLPSVVVTFEPHPLKLLSPASAPSLITTVEQKIALIADSAIDYLVVVPFTMDISRMSAEDFVCKILCDSLGMRHIIIGHDYAFGRGREGNYETLERLGAVKNFTLEDIDPFGDGNSIFSSSLVRNLIVSGETAAASIILGRYYMIGGKVVRGREIGQAIGYPTANISTVNELIPADGVYAVMVRISGRLVKGACSVGKNPTFSSLTRTIEVFLLDFSEQVYENEVSVYFVQKLRNLIRFATVSDLVKAIDNDVNSTRNILSGINLNMLKP
jgi:riboflavin kinase / FMN adenylyltransferase